MTPNSNSVDGQTDEQNCDSNNGQRFKKTYSEVETIGEVYVSANRTFIVTRKLTNLCSECAH